MIRFYFDEIAKSQLLHLKDKRSIYYWCIKNQVPIYKEESKSFVSQADFEIAYNLPITNRLKQNFPDQWENLYRLYNIGDLTELIKLRQNYESPSVPEFQNRKVHTKRIKKYEPQSNLSKKIIDEFLSNSAPSLN